MKKIASVATELDVNGFPKEANVTKDENIKKSLIDKIIQVGEFPIIH